VDFQKLIRLFSSSALGGVLSVKNQSYDRLVESLSEVQFISRDFDADEEATIITLQILDDDMFYRLLAGEANKFLLASRVTLDRANQSQQGNVAWQAVEHYYAAYYAIQYLIRLTGISITNLSDPICRSISRDIEYQLNKKVDVNGGLYSLKFSESEKCIYLKQEKQKRAGGSHKGAWKLWSDLVDNLIQGAGADIEEYIDTSLRLAEHKKFLYRSKNQFNPSEVRAEINYQFKGGVWIFEKNSTRSIDRLNGAIGSSFIGDLSREVSPDTLISNNKLIIDFAKNFFLFSSDKYPKSICRQLSNKYSGYFSNA